MRSGYRSRPAAIYTALLVLALLAIGAQSYLGTRARLMPELLQRLEAACALTADVLQSRPASRRELPSIVRDLARLCAARVEVVSSAGAVVAASEESLASADQSQEPEVRLALEGGSGWSKRSVVPHQPQRLFVARRVLGSPWVVRLSAPLDTITRASLEAARDTMAVAAAGAIPVLALAAWRRRAVTRFVAVLSRRVEAIGSGADSPSPGGRVAPELRPLAEAAAVSSERVRQALRELSEAASGLETTLDQMADGVLVVGADETIRTINPAAARLLGANRSTAVGRRLVETTLDFDLAELVRRALRTGVLVEGRPRPSDDGARIVSAAAKPLAGPAGEFAGTVITLRDVTQAHRFQQARQDFVANASHELRTPLAAIAAMAETLQDGAADDPEARERFLTRIIDNTRSMTHLVGDMMALAKLEEDTPSEPEARPLDVREALAAAASRLEPQATAGGVSITVDAPDGMHVWCSEDDLTAALVNLVDNAVKYSPDGAEVALHAEASDGAVRISVTDHGPGIPEPSRERVFERFYRVDKGRSRLLGGTGLGLSIVRHAIERNGGRVWVESPEHEGSRFVVLLPASPPRPSDRGP